MTAVIGALVACRAPRASPSGDRAEDVRAWVDEYEESWNTHDAAALAGFFSEDADFIVGNGPRLVGRAAVEEWWRGYFAGIDDGREGTFAVASVRAITPLVVVVNVNSATAGQNDSGDALPTRSARGTWVVTRHGGRLEIAAFRALPAEGELRSAPGRDR